ncbi:MAG: hypothetical protein Q8Q97_02235 [bacterium]|nr:hypothetical protein [bacterium]
MKKQWNNWTVFFASVVVAVIITPFLESLYREMLYSGGGFSSFIIPSDFSTYPSTFLLLYTLFLTFFYRTFSKNFKPITLVYFLALPFLLFISSTQHIAAFLILLAAGWLLGYFVSKILPQ